MKNIETTSRLALSALLLATLLPSPVEAFFERVQAGARGTAIGQAYTAIADDASAIYWNPAALVTMRQAEILVQHARPFAIGDLQSNFVTAAFHRGRSAFSVGWHHTGVTDIVGEDLIYLGTARDILPYGRGYALSLGGNLKIASVGYSSTADQDYGRETKVTADLSALFNATEKLSFGYVVRNVTEPSFDFVSGSGETTLDRSHDFGIGYRWNAASTFAMSLTRDTLGDWWFHTGGEIWFYDVFGIRSGVSRTEFVGGVGLRTERYLVDVAFMTHSELGISYELALRIPLGERRW